MAISADQFLSLRETLPVIDVRSEAEFHNGHIPGAKNIPLLSNKERTAVGTDYKQKGQAEAIKTGFRMVGPRLIDIVAETEIAAPQHELIAHCWRGGMRSAYYCDFVNMAGFKTHSLQGGYKAYRNLVHQAFEQPFQFVVIGGYTGSGKTEILHTLAKAGEQVIDLEQLARHKGSVFGGLMMPPQPTNEQFENDLFEVIHALDWRRRIWIEDESVAVGKIFLPQALWKTMNRRPVVEIHVEKDNRVQRLVTEYGKSDPDEFLNALTGIAKKLGGQHYKAAKEKLLEGNWYAAIDIVLTYYDKAYHNGLIRKQERIVRKISWDGKNAEQVIQQIMQIQK